MTRRDAGFKMGANTPYGRENTKTRSGESCQGGPGTKNLSNDNYHDQRLQSIGEASPSAGWRTVYYAMGVRPR